MENRLRLLSHILEELDYHDLYKAYPTKGTNPAVVPKLMFKIVVYAYSQGIYSAEKLKKPADVTSTSCGFLQVPKHLTIARYPVSGRCSIPVSANPCSASLPYICWRLEK